MTGIRHCVCFLHLERFGLFVLFCRSWKYALFLSHWKCTQGWTKVVQSLPEYLGIVRRYKKQDKPQLIWKTKEKEELRICIFFYHSTFNNVFNCYSKAPASQQKESWWLCCLCARSIMRGNTHVSISTMCLVFSLLVRQCQPTGALFKSLAGHLKLAEIDCTIYWSHLYCLGDFNLMLIWWSADEVGCGG